MKWFAAPLTLFLAATAIAACSSDDPKKSGAKADASTTGGSGGTGGGFSGSGGSSGAGAGGSGATGGGPGGQGGTAGSDPCLSCGEPRIDGDCQVPATTCQGDAECRSIMGCVYMMPGCPVGASGYACIENCIEQYCADASDAAMFLEFETCMFCEDCSSTCGEYCDGFTADASTVSCGDPDGGGGAGGSAGAGGAGGSAAGGGASGSGGTSGGAGNAGSSGASGAAGASGSSGSAGAVTDASAD